MTMRKKQVVLSHAFVWVIFILPACLAGDPLIGWEETTTQVAPTLTVSPSSTALPAIPTPTQIVGLICPEPMLSPDERLMCFPVGFVRPSPELDEQGNPTGVVYQPGELVIVDLDRSTHGRCFLGSSPWYVSCRDLEIMEG